jgi:DUF4097 and DUF4098 domain-containing protein YvlB
VVKTHGGRDVIIEGRVVTGGLERRGRGQSPPESAGLQRLAGRRPEVIIEEERNVLTISSSAFADPSDLEIQVPAKTNLTLQTMSGDRGITIDGVDGEIEVTNMNGPVTMNNVAGSVIAHSMNSKIVASMRDVTPNKMISFTSMNGNIDVTLPATVKANLKMRTDKGEIYSDFDVKPRVSASASVESSVTRDGRGPRVRMELNQALEGAVNNGGTDIEMRSFNGNIFIRKSPK